MALKWTSERIQILLTASCGILLVVHYIASIPGVNLGRPVHYSSLAAIFGAYFAVKSALASVREKSLDVNLLMVLAAAGAVAVGRISDAAVLLFLFSLSSTLEALAMAKTQSAIEALVRLRPDEAILVTQEGDMKVRVESLAVGDVVRVLPFEPVPTDGKLLSERASLNESAMTGESRPVERSRGESLMAGTQNLDAMALMEVTHAVGDSTLEKIVGLVQEAQDNKASGERISRWFGERYTVFVLVAFLGSLILRLVTGQAAPDAFYGALVLLVVLSPCALVISSPAAALSALAFAARRGTLVRGGQYIEEAGRVTMVCLDKTGTLTEGRPQVVEICVMDCSSKPIAAVVGGAVDRAGAACATEDPEHDGIACWHGEGEIQGSRAHALMLAASAEQFSTHPIAEAIVEFGRSHGLTIPEAERHQTVAGMGVEAQVQGETVRVGQLRFFEGQSLPDVFREHVEEMRSRGITAVLIQATGFWAAIGLRDEARPEAREFVVALRKSGVRRVAMLTGDNEATAIAVAREVGIDEVHAGLLPADKKELLDRFTREGQRIMMVGDGVNDAPALTQAHLGVAMGGLGSEVALRAADVVLVQDRIERLPELIRLGDMTNRIIRANLLFAAGVIVCLTIASFFTKLPLPIAVVGHEGSTVLVILNGLRLLRGPKALPPG